MKFKQVLGTILLLIGAAYLLDAFELINFNLSSFIGMWYPVAVAAFGAYLIYKANYITGVILLLVGLALQFDKFDLIDFNFWEMIIPALFLITGFYLLFGSKGKLKRYKNKSSFYESRVEEDNFEVNSIFGESNQKVKSESLINGDIFTLFGSAEVDLTQCKVSDKFRKIDATSVFGSIQLFVPREWNVHTKGTPLFGSIENKTVNSPESVVSVKIDCTTAFGSIEIRN